jgi:hypothetical protein
MRGSCCCAASHMASTAFGHSVGLFAEMAFFRPTDEKARHAEIVANYMLRAQNGGGCQSVARTVSLDHLLTVMHLVFNTLILATLLLPALSLAKDDKEANTCSVTSVPIESGYFEFMGVLARVYPAPPKITPSFNGCQSLWSVDGGITKIEFRVRFESGVPVAVLGPDLPREEPLKCEPRSTGSSSEFNCPPLGLLPFSSLPKECIVSHSSPPDSRGYRVSKSCRKPSFHAKGGPSPPAPPRPLS